MGLRFRTAKRSRSGRRSVGAVLLLIVLAELTGCATTGPTHLYLAGEGAQPIWDRALEDQHDDTLTGLLASEDRVIGVGYEYNTDYIWLRLAPGDTLVAIKRAIREEWYRYELPVEFAGDGERTLDIAVRSFNRMVYAALPEPGLVGKVTRYGKVLPAVRPGGTIRPIGGLAWDQAADQLLVLYADTAEIVAHDRETEVVRRVNLQAAVSPTTLAYDSNRRRFYVPLADAAELGEFDESGRLIERLPWPEGAYAIDAGQRSLVRVF